MNCMFVFNSESKLPCTFPCFKTDLVNGNSIGKTVNIGKTIGYNMYRVPYGVLCDPLTTDPLTKVLVLVVSAPPCRGTGFTQVRK